MKDQKINLVNIGAEDIEGGNLALILGMIWTIILRYQIKGSSTTNKKDLLAWVSALTGKKTDNFSSR